MGGGGGGIPGPPPPPPLYETLPMMTVIVTTFEGFLGSKAECYTVSGDPTPSSLFITHTVHTVHVYHSLL